MYKSDKAITYVFGAGRLSKLNSNSIKAREFFYGYQHLSKNNDLEIIEMDFPNNSNNKFLKYLDKILRKITKFPIYTKDILHRKNFKILKKTDKLIITTDLLALSILPFLLVVKLFNKLDIFIIVMGLFGRQSNNLIIKFFQNIYMSLLNSITKSYIFLGNGEFKNALSLNPKNSNKFKFLSFCIDTEFWKPSNSPSQEKEGILFIGNDGKRDYKLVEKIAESLPEINFTFITSQIIENSLSNVNLIKGSWGKEILTDEEIRKYYQNSRLTIIPLIETFQPSGQSVALQSMSCGTPVMITDTKGFWDKEEFINNKNIIFVKENKIDLWVGKIKEFYYSDKLLKNLSNNGVLTINNQFKLSRFDTNLEKIIYE